MKPVSQALLFKGILSTASTKPVINQGLIVKFDSEEIVLFMLVIILLNCLFLICLEGVFPDNFFRNPLEYTLTLNYSCNNRLLVALLQYLT